MLILGVVLVVIVIAINVYKAIYYELHKDFSLSDSPLDRFKLRYEKQAMKKTTTLKKKK